MDNIEVISLYEDSNKQRADKFISKTQSTLKVDIDKSKITRDVEWIDMMNFTVPYIDNIFRSPNRFIVNEEEIVKNTFKYRDYLNTMYQYQKLITELKNG